ncbi:MAG: TauD/TfdA family dioxygenase [Deltaproteobacteria bacterium]|nr:TauD/TfdA family dioxygenase [Deltaproteobacteria bacterium]
MTNLQILPVTPTIGAEIKGVDLRTALSEDEVEVLRKALLEHLVLFFRDQDIGPEQQVAFAKQFGEISVPPILPESGIQPEVMILDQTSPKDQGADNWHSDNTFMEEPPKAAILKATRLPNVGGDTLFASAEAAFEALSPPMQKMLSKLTAVHDITKPLRTAAAAGLTNFDIEALSKQWPAVEHPVVRTHPITGRKALYVNRNSTLALKGLTQAEGELLLPFLCDHIRSPEFQCRLRWDLNTVAFWDNCSVQHFAVPDYNERRIMQRVTLAGDKPF